MLACLAKHVIGTLPLPRDRFTEAKRAAISASVSILTAANDKPMRSRLWRSVTSSSHEPEKRYQLQRERYCYPENSNFWERLGVTALARASPSHRISRAIPARELAGAAGPSDAPVFEYRQLRGQS